MDKMNTIPLKMRAKTQEMNKFLHNSRVRNNGFVLILQYLDIAKCLIEAICCRLNKNGDKFYELKVQQEAEFEEHFDILCSN
jgi:hypothetical protein